MNNKLIDLLTIFKQAREKLSQDFLNKDIEIFKPMFQYEEDNELMSLAIEKYFTGYINCHFEIFSNYTDIDVEFSKAMLSFIGKLNISVSDSNLNNGKELFSTLIKQKELLLNEMLLIGNIDSERFNKLSYSYHRDKTLFDREMKKLQR